VKTLRGTSEEENRSADDFHVLPKSKYWM